MKQKFISIAAIFLVFILFLSGCASKESASKTGGASQQDASQLTGLWRGEKAFQLNFQTKKLEERAISPLDVVEFKDGQACIVISGGSPNAYNTGKFSLICGAYRPYTLNGDRLTIEGRADIITWHLIDGKLELAYKKTQRDPVYYTKVIYRKLSEAEIYKEGEPVDGKVPIRIEGTPIQ